jgi:predicted aspartyl protease
MKARQPGKRSPWWNHLPWLALLLVLPWLTACQSLVRGRQTNLTAEATVQLQQRMTLPEVLGLTVTERNGQTSVRWREMVRPELAVQVPLVRAAAGSVQPFVTARLNTGRPLALLLDTGAPVSMVQADMALKHNLAVADPTRLKNLYRGAGGLEEAWYGMIRQMTIGTELAFRNVFVAIRPQTHSRKLLGLFTVADWDSNLIGMSTLGNFAFFTIDYPQQTAVLSHRDFYPGPRFEVVAQAPLSHEQQQLHIPMRLGTDTNLHAALVDTGNEASIMLPASLAQKLGWGELILHGRNETYLGLGGEFTARAFKIPRLRIGETEFLQVPAVTGPEEFGLVLGSGFLRAYRVSFDLRRKQLWLEKPTPRTNVVVPRNRRF